MDNERLRILVELYYDCKKQLNDLRQQSEKDELEKTILNDTGVIIQAKIGETKDGIVKMRLQSVWRNVVMPKLNDACSKAEKSRGEITLPAVENDIAYLEARLEAIKKLIGESNCKAIEKYEEEKILKNE